MTALETQLAVTCRGVVKTYGGEGNRVYALRGIDLEVRTGELMMLVGPSGCGKTTLISVIAGILDQDEGTCEVFGKDLLHLKARAKTRFRGENVGFVFQQFNLIPSLSAAENVAVPLLINGVGRGEAAARAVEMLKRVGLGDRIKSLPRQMSGGQQQRVAIARALVHGPKMIVCDEPTSALDHETGHRVMELLREVALGEGRALVIVTHDSRIFEFGDRIAKMDDGRIVKVVESAEQLEH
ncbi:MAG TPA: ABC transporter ATP-binding protein [Tepidisphaeraceae bacterium]|jgi:putative ABC transport system ATP-binding protein|nr:ABC transporter ATP-binding protein [Tepidisphaeraceae bacterium]